MTQVFLITEPDSFATSVERYLRDTRGFSVHRVFFPPVTQSEEVLRVFRQIADAIEHGNNDDPGLHGLRNAIAIIDLADESLLELEDLNPITRSLRQASVVAMLVLAFPEIHWVFITPYRPINASVFEQAHTLGASNSLAEILSLHDDKFTSLFDATNLRNTIRRSMHEKNLASDQITSHIPLRQKLAAAIDEEEAYAYFNAYTAYRFGFRSHVVASYNMMRMLFEEPSRESHEPASLTFEDIYLNFPDESPHIHLSNLKKRDEQFSKLQEPKHRVFVTVGHRHDQQAWNNNREHLRHLRSQGKFCNILYKPLSGIFDLWEKSGLRRWLHASKGLAPGFCWPPPQDGAQEPQGHHSAPGRLLEIADRLIARAERILHTAMSVPEAVHGAVLALEAQELLGNKTPTTALEALALKHQLEVTAECMFYGVEYNFDVQSRFEDIHRDVKSIGRWFHPSTRRLSALNAEISIMSDLAQRFRQYNQFDEEQECLQRIRELHRHLWFRKNKEWAWIFYPARWYIEYLLGRMHRFVFAIIFWLLFLSFSFDAFCGSQESGLIAALSGPAHALTSFFGMQPLHELDLQAISGPGAGWLTMLAIVLGFIHLGVFVSHLYAIIARK